MIGRALWLADVLADAFRGVKGFRVVAESGWESRGFASLSPRGIINHHTGGGDATWAAQKRYITSGSSISPLANWGTSRPINGVVEIAVIAAGKANHAGKGYLPWTGTDRGNNYAIGGEHQNDGRQAWPDQHVEAIRIGSAALLTKIGVGVDRMADHKDYAPSRKVDRHSTDLATERRAVAKIMAGGAGTSTGTGSTDMALTSDEETTVKRLHKAMKEMDSDAYGFGKHGVELIRALRTQMDGIEFADQLEAISEEMNTNPYAFREMVLHLRNHPDKTGPSEDRVRAIVREEVARAGAGSGDVDEITAKVIARLQATTTIRDKG